MSTREIFELTLDILKEESKMDFCKPKNWCKTWEEYYLFPILEFTSKHGGIKISYPTGICYILSVVSPSLNEEAYIILNKYKPNNCWVLQPAFFFNPCDVESRIKLIEKILKEYDFKN